MRTEADIFSKKLFCFVIFLTLILFPGLLWAVMMPQSPDCNVRGYDGTEIVKFNCQDDEAFEDSPSPLQIRTPDGKIRGIVLVEETEEIKSGFRVRLADGTIKALDIVGITTCEELQMIGYHPAYPSNKAYKLGSDIDCLATAPAAMTGANAGSLWELGYDEKFNNKGLDGVEDPNPATGFYDDSISALDLSNLGDKGFKPLAVFWGTLDGRNFVIKNLFINRVGLGNEGINVGLFGSLSYDPAGPKSPKIKNLGLVNVNITGRYMVGGLAGSCFANRVSIDNCYVKDGQVVGIGAPSGVPREGLGGMVGYAKMSDWTSPIDVRGSITESYTNVPVKGNAAQCFEVGGLIGHLDGYLTISDSYATGVVTGASTVGGLVGLLGSGSIITHSHATGAVTGNNYVGGLVGNMYGDSSYPLTSITNSYAGGTVKGKLTYGGLVGALGTGSVGPGASIITSSYATGAVIPNGLNVNVRRGGLVGIAKNDSIANSYATGNVTGGAWGYSGGLVGLLQTNASITNTYATGDVTGSGSVGGLVGLLQTFASITNAYATGNVTGTGSVGGLLGNWDNVSSLTNNWWYNGSSIADTGNYGNVNDEWIAKFSAGNDAFDPANAPLSSWSTDVWEFRKADGKYPKLKNVDGTQ